MLINHVMVNQFAVEGREKSIHCQAKEVRPICWVNKDLISHWLINNRSPIRCAQHKSTSEDQEIFEIRW